MSFILDALKKLERDKQAGEPGVVMVGPVPWGGADRRRRGRMLVLAAIFVAAALIGTWWWLGVGPAAAPQLNRGAATGTTVEPGRTGQAAESEPTPSPAQDTAARAPVAPAHAPPPTEPPLAPAPRELELPPAEPAPSALAPVEPVTPGEAEEAVAAEPEEEPTEPPAPVDTAPQARVPPRAEFRLTAISTRDGEPIALLNDRLVREGDSFEGVRILRIGATEVEIEVDGERRTIGF